MYMVIVLCIFVDNRDPKFEDAMKEMMERIKGGATLRPVGNRRVRTFVVQRWTVHKIFCNMEQ